VSGLDRLLGTRVRSTGRDPIATLFPKQAAAALDPSDQVALLCGRRSGKTQAFMRKALSVMRRFPGCRIPYIALTRQSAKGILWREALKANKQLGLNLTLRLADLTLTDANGSEIFLVGANKADEVEKLRGQAFPLIGVDEAASFRGTLLQYLLEDVLAYALMDFNGALWLLGTPNAASIGYFHAVTTGKVGGWSVHHWTALDNPFMPDARGWMERRMKKRGWDWHHPSVKREFLGEWARDEDALVYKFSRTLHMVDRLPDDYYLGGKGWGCTLALDYGVVNAYAWAVWKFRTQGGDPTMYCVEAGKKSGQTPTDAADHTKLLIETFDPHTIVGDAGGLGKAYIEQTRQRHGIQIAHAEKTDKLAHIELFNDDLRARPPRAYLLRDTTEVYAEEMELLQWDLRKVEVSVGGVIRHEERKVEDPRFENDVCDAGLYGNRASKAYLNEPTVKRPVDLSTDAFERERTEDDQWQHQTESAWWDRD
jgi:hypothetical protein